MPTPVSHENCPVPHCDAPEVSCNMGWEKFSDCPHWKAEGDDSETPTSNSVEKVLAVEESNLRLPWTGNTLGRRDLEFVASRALPYLVGVVGSHNAGKTTLLTMVYLLASRGERFAQSVFSGSYSIGGWEGLAYHLRWQPGGTPTFPPHTSRSAGRIPGLLHLALRRLDDSCQDVLFTDAPGEWFSRWAIERDAHDAEGARWVAQKADMFMLLADSEALSGSQRGEARSQLQDLARRLGEGLNGRPVAIVWSKSDIRIPAALQDALRVTFDRVFPAGWVEYSVSVDQSSESVAAGFHDLLNWVFSFPDQSRAETGLLMPVFSPEDPMLAFRGR